MTKAQSQAADYAAELATRRERMVERIEELRLASCASWRQHDEDHRRMLEAHRELEAYDKRHGREEG